MAATTIGNYNMKNLNQTFERYKWGDRVLGCRFSTVSTALLLLDNSKANNFVETGTTRRFSSDPQTMVGDGGMTRFFGEYVKIYGGHIWTCDIEPSHIENCKLATEEYKQNITYVVDDSLNFLKSFDKEVDFLYLDSLDGDQPGAHEHQLKEVENIYHRLTDNTIVLLDDLGSKTNLSIPFLMKKDWIRLAFENLPQTHKMSQGLMIHKNRLCGS